MRRFFSISGGMRKINRYTGISIVLHIILAGMIAYAGFTHQELQRADVFQVGLVGAGPYPDSGGSGANGSNKGIGHVPSSNSEATQELSEVEKEELPSDAEPDVTQPMTDSPQNSGQNNKFRDNQTITSSPGQSSGADTGRPGQGGGGGGGGSGQSSYILDLWRSRCTSTGKNGLWSEKSSYLPVLWRSQVTSLVHRVWKAYAGDAFVDKRLKATYLLRIAGNGDLLDTKLIMPSGDRSYDLSMDSTFNIIRKLPKPPPVLLNGREVMEITMSFPNPASAVH
jgi:hypothetical protein